MAVVLFMWTPAEGLKVNRVEPMHLQSALSEGWQLTEEAAKNNHTIPANPEWFEHDDADKAAEAALGSENKKSDPVEDLASLSLEELRALAKDRGIEGAETMRTPKLLRVLSDDDSQG